MQDGERQVAPTLDGVRKDHVARYNWAAQTLPAGSRVIDVGCGVGYGAFILAQAGHTVYAVDKDEEAIAYAGNHYDHPLITRIQCDAEILGFPEGLPPFDAAICFEVIEHVVDPLPMLRKLSDMAPVLLASVPNEKYFPFRGYKFHQRHYTRHEFESLLGQAGFSATEVLGQVDAESDVGSLPGRTLVVSARRSAKLELVAPASVDAVKVPGHVVILGLGPSLESYVGLIKRDGARKAFADEVWGINAVGDVIHCDRIFHMDDVRIQEKRAEASPKSNIANMLTWLRTHPGPIYTSRPHEDYPGLIAYPLEDVINVCGYTYFNSTVAYAVAYAVYLRKRYGGLNKISLFGIDFTYPNAQHAEQGRACVEFWLGLAAECGIELGISERSSLMDHCLPEERRLYGYDTVHVDIDDTAAGSAKVTFRERAKVASAAEIEDRYDHYKHPSPLLRQVAAE